ncbi:citrate lyase beta subunit [Variovorax sp. CF313]|uniref:HpcH/HpaI aldolase/citrate lyase family protein n=1 Tax=Variovorax sp. CF313 TaxID=1144315 RepID=UPI000270EC26|nr:aldolase/citrate lyase family protein [Variovorax sp. CF313]EJL72305.1 citrate lyase beta subunit [Variovorax sp. CF313]
MTTTPPPLHPSVALFSGEKALPSLAPCEHYAGSEKLIAKALQLQAELGPVFDVTCDCEDGAAAGQEKAHAEMAARFIASQANRHDMVGARIHDASSTHWRTDIDTLIGDAGHRLAYLTLPKAVRTADVALMIEYIRTRSTVAGLPRDIPVHVLIETHGALRDVFEIAALPNVQVLDFGLMDFVSDHQGAIGFEAMRSPGQFEHPLLVRAKTRIVAAALANGLVPAHNVSLTLRDPLATRNDAYRARREFGFLRMWSVHPDQIRPIVEAMTPDAGETQQAAQILLAAGDAQWGPIRHEGELHDRATYRYFWSVLRAAEAGGADLPPQARQRFFART